MAQFADNHEFAKLVAGQCDINLVNLMFEFAEDLYPDLDRVGCLLQIDHLAVACENARGAQAARNPGERLTHISRVLYDEEGFHGNRENYYDPRNSYLHEVLSRRCGIPISLGILYMAVAARIGIRVFGVNTPGHFVLGCCQGQERWFVDPFSGGDVLNDEDCKCRVESMVGQYGIVYEAHLRPATPLEIAARVLRNLKTAHAMQEHWNAVLAVQHRLTRLLPQADDEKRDLGLVYLRLGKPGQALELLEPYAAGCSDEQAAAVRPSLKQARRMIAEQN